MASRWMSTARPATWAPSATATAPLPRWPTWSAAWWLPKAKLEASAGARAHFELAPQPQAEPNRKSQIEIEIPPPRPRRRARLRSHPRHQRSHGAPAPGRPARRGQLPAPHRAARTRRGHRHGGLREAAQRGLRRRPGFPFRPQRHCGGQGLWLVEGRARARLDGVLRCAALRHRIPGNAGVDLRPRPARLRPLRPGAD